MKKWGEAIFRFKSNNAKVLLNISCGFESSVEITPFSVSVLKIFCDGIKCFYDRYFTKHNLKLSYNLKVKVRF